jgi:hypothetical protein
MSLIGTGARKHNVLRNESGQAVIEYILVLTITVLLIGTALYQFSSAFRSYATNYFGEYISCLLETGELPGQTAGECKDLWKPFSIADGKTSTGGQIGTGGIGSGSGGANGSGSNDGSSGSSSGSKGKNGKGGRGNGSSSDGSSGSTASNSGGETVGPGASGGSDPFGGGGGRRRSTRVKTSSASDAAGAGQKGREGLKPIGAYSSSSSSSSDRDGRGRRTILDRGYGYAGQEEEAEREESRPATKAVGRDDSDRLKPAKVRVDVSRAPASNGDDDGGGFTIGGFLRILLIAGILIAIFILFGGQLLAISKGGEK